MRQEQRRKEAGSRQPKEKWTAVCVWAHGISSQDGSWNGEEAMGTRVGVEGSRRTGRIRWLIGLLLVCSGRQQKTGQSGRGNGSSVSHSLEAQSQGVAVLFLQRPFC